MFEVSLFAVLKARYLHEIQFFELFDSYDIEIIFQV